MPMDIALQARKDPSQRITVLYNHWIEVLEPQGQWVPVEESPAPETPAPKKRGRPRKEQLDA